MHAAQLTSPPNFVSHIRKDAAIDSWVRAKQRDCIRPMTAPRRLDTVFSEANHAVFHTKTLTALASIAAQDDAPRTRPAKARADATPLKAITE